MGDRLWAGIPLLYVTKPTRSTQPCISSGLQNRVPALIGWRKDGNVNFAGWSYIIIIIIIIMWLVQWTLPFPQATSMPVDFVLDDRQLSDQ